MDRLKEGISLYTEKELLLYPSYEEVVDFFQNEIINHKKLKKQGKEIWDRIYIKKKLSHIVAAIVLCLFSTVALYQISPTVRAAVIYVTEFFHDHIIIDINKKSTSKLLKLTRLLENMELEYEYESSGYYCADYVDHDSDRKLSFIASSGQLSVSYDNERHTLYSKKIGEYDCLVIKGDSDSEWNTITFQYMDNYYEIDFIGYDEEDLEIIIKNLK